MLIACWSVKGGAGTTVLAAALALVAARQPAAEALLVDLAGDAAMVLGAPGAGTAGATGVHDWLGTAGAAPETLARLEQRAAAGLALLPAGLAPAEPPPAGRIVALRRYLAAEARTVVVDCGLVGAAGSLRAALATSAACSLLVVRNCYLAARRAEAAPLRPTGLVVVEEPGRALEAADLAAALGTPVMARVAYDPAVARAADAGLLHTRLPRPLCRGLRRLLEPSP